MKVLKFKVAGRVSVGMVIGLTATQADDRGHKLTKVKRRAVGKDDERREFFKVAETLNFKKGEVVGFVDDEKLDRQLEKALGMVSEVVAIEAPVAKVASQDEGGVSDDDEEDGNPDEGDGNGDDEEDGNPDDGDDEEATEDQNSAS